MGYLIEESLSVDNLFVIALILAYFRRARRRIPASAAVLGHQRRC